MVATKQFLTSCGSGALFLVASPSSRSLLQRSFHNTDAHSDAAIRKRRRVPVLIFPASVLILRRGGC